MGKRVAAEVHDVDAILALVFQVVAMNKTLESLSFNANVKVASSPALRRDWCGENHASKMCSSNPVSGNFMVNYLRNQNNLYSNTYNLWWRNHPNFAWNGFLL